MAIKSYIDSVLTDVSDHFIKEHLQHAFAGCGSSFEDIERSFSQLTAHQQPENVLCQFFHSWSQTNNSAVTVAGIGNRLTLRLHQGEQPHDIQHYLQAMVSLDRIIDEDLAVVGGILHSDLFYRMATSITGHDRWLSREFLSQEAIDFKRWKDRNSLRNPDLMVALLTTLVHEIYTHGEVEHILPLFERWMDESYAMPRRDVRNILAWISIHTGPTEKNHFYHAISAVQNYAVATQTSLNDYDLEQIVFDYMTKKAIVMKQLEGVMALSVAHADSIAV